MTKQRRIHKWLVLNEKLEKLITRTKQRLVDRHIVSRFLINYYASLPYVEWKKDLEREFGRRIRSVTKQRRIHKVVVAMERFDKFIRRLGQRQIDTKRVWRLEINEFKD